MAINPITSDFVAGSVLTASQQNRLPRGVLAFNESSASLFTISSAETTVCTVTFTIPSTRQIQIVADIPLFDLPSTTQRVLAMVYQSTTLILRHQSSASTTMDATDFGISTSVALAAGTYTFTLRASVTTGTNRINAAGGTASLCRLTAIDLGPA